MNVKTQISEKGYSMEKEIYVSVVAPVYNEENTIEASTRGSQKLSST